MRCVISLVPHEGVGEEGSTDLGKLKLERTTGLCANCSALSYFVNHFQSSISGRIAICIRDAMDTADLYPLLDDLTSNIDDLEDSLAPLLKTALSTSTSKLPLLDKAKLYVLVTYAIESILFSCLRLDGVDAKAHPVFQELARVKAYFAKIKAAETPAAKRNVTLDKDAAGRFIRHGLAGNEKFDRERAGRVSREMTGAKRKADAIGVGRYTRFDGAAKRIKADEAGESGAGTPSNGVGSELEGDHQSAVASAGETNEVEPVESKKTSKQRQNGTKASEPSPTDSSSTRVRPSHGGGLDEDADEGGVSLDGPHTIAEDSKQALEALLDDSLEKTKKKTKSRKKKGKRSKGQRMQDEIADEMK